ncbi:MAG: hypothetical protein ABGX20_14450 [Bacillus sp. (in: firmicutes)]
MDENELAFLNEITDIQGTFGNCPVTSIRKKYCSSYLKHPVAPLAAELQFILCYFWRYTLQSVFANKSALTLCVVGTFKRGKYLALFKIGIGG